MSVDMRTYFLFQVRGERFAYHRESERFFRVDATAQRLLELCTEMPIVEASNALQCEGIFSSEEVNDVAAELQSFAANGFFDPPRDHPKPSHEETLERRLIAPRKRIELVLAETCNLACKYCYGIYSGERGSSGNGLMSSELARAAIDWLIANSGDDQAVCLAFFGGEPLLNREVLMDAVSYSAKRSQEMGKTVTYSITTNGILLDDDVVDLIKSHNFGLMVSLDGPRAIHDSQRPYPDGRSSFDDTVAGIRRLMRKRKRVTVRCTYTRQSGPLRGLLDFFEEFGFARVALAPATNPAAAGPLDCDAETLDSLARQLEEEAVPWILERLDQGRNPIYFPYLNFIQKQTAETPPGRMKPGIRCGACFGEMTVGADGTLYPCHRFVGMRSFAIGQLRDGPDHDRIRSFWSRYYGALGDKCVGCWADQLCSPPCPWALAEKSGGFRQCLEPEACRGVRQHLMHGVWMLWRIQTKYPEFYTSITRTIEVAAAGAARLEAYEPLGGNN